MRQRDSEMLFELIHTALGYWRAQVLLSANELGVFDILDEGAMTAQEVADRAQTHPDYTERLLNACVATKLLKKADGRFSNQAIADSFLVAGRPQFMGNWIRLMSAWYRPFGELSTAIRTGEPAEDPARHLGADADYTRDFIMAMHDYALGPGKEMLRHVELAECRRLLDLGGGAGSYSILLAGAYDQLRPVVFDLPEVAQIAREVIAESGLSDRIEVQAGDYASDNVGDGYDVLLLSNMLHQEDRATCLALLRKAHGALVEGGQLIVQAMFLNRDKDGPLWPALQSLITLLVYHGGRTYSLEETLELIGEAGFTDIEVRRMSLLNAESLILARKPAPGMP
jgi:hypothetical protein